MEINYAVIKEQVWDYFDVEAIKAKLGKANDKDFNPFKFGNSGKPLGFQQIAFSTTGMAVELVYALLYIVEKMVSDAGEVAKGTDKKKALVELLDAAIKLPIPFEWFDGKIINWLIDEAVGWLNKKFGKDWIKHIPKPELILDRAALNKPAPAPAAPVPPVVTLAENEPATTEDN